MKNYKLYKHRTLPMLILVHESGQGIIIHDGIHNNIGILEENIWRTLTKPLYNRIDNIVLDYTSSKLNSIMYRKNIHRGGSVELLVQYRRRKRIIREDGIEMFLSTIDANDWEKLDKIKFKSNEEY